MHQLSLLDVIAAEEAGDVPLCLYRSPARGLPAREAEFGAWRARYGNFGCVPNSHAWHLPSCAPHKPTPRCQPTVLSADVRRQDHWTPKPEPGCGCWATDELMYRGACTGCDWEGAERCDANLAVEDAMDHSHPGWQDVPVIRKPPPAGAGQSAKEKAAAAAWIAAATAKYPAGWLEAGGPIRTLRTPGTRHVECATPWGGYDLAVVNAP
jgi:hypothetical protein